MRKILIGLFVLIISTGNVMATKKEEDERLKRLKEREGLELKVYKDSLDKDSIGIGHLITDEEKKSGKIHGISFTKGITEDQAEKIKKIDLKSHDDRTDKTLTKYGLDKTLNRFQKIAVKDAAFQLGPNWLDEHKNTRKLLQEGKFKEAGEEAANSNWYKQTPKRVHDFQRNINRLEQEDVISKTDSAPIRKPSMIEEEEEKKKPTLDRLRQATNKELLDISPTGQELSVAARKDLQRKLVNPDNQVKGATESQELKAQGQKPSVKNEFMEALTYFLPAIGGLAIGGAIGGSEGAAQGAQMGMKAGASFAKHKLDKAKLDQSQRPDETAQQRIDISKSNLELRKKEIKEQQKRTTNLEEDRTLRREERDIDRSLKIKESFGKRGDIKRLQEQRAMFDDIDNIITEAPEVAAGVISFKIAKGIAGEVGNLTQAEREDAQISPSFYRKAIRSGAKFFTGRLPEEDTKELKKVVAALRKKQNSKVGTIIDGYSKSRGKTLSNDYQKFLNQDLRNEYGVDSKEDKKEGTSSDRLSKWDEDKKKRYMEWKARRNK